MYSPLTFVRQRIDDPQIEPPGSGPPRLQVFILHADQSPPRTLYLPTIDTSTEPPLALNKLEHEPQAIINDSEFWMAAHQARLSRSGYRPDIRVLPDPR